MCDSKNKNTTDIGNEKRNPDTYVVLEVGSVNFTTQVHT